MAIKVYTKEQQGTGAFDGGKIMEKKPVGFPGEGSELKPYSNVFYWAHAWSDEGGLIAEHPHRGFEIMSFVLKGEIQHYDSHYEEWKSLKKGDAQIIRAGNGITHAERLLENSAMFQIWIDPDLNKTLQQPASYNDYKENQFPLLEKENFNVRIYKGEGAPFEMDAPGIGIKKYHFKEGNIVLALDDQSIYSCFLLNGKLKMEEQEVKAEEFVVIKEENELLLNVSEAAELFVLTCPKDVPYNTYAGQTV